jgi:hypothetical protein
MPRSSQNQWVRSQAADGLFRHPTTRFDIVILGAVNDAIGTEGIGADVRVELRNVGGVLH